MLKLFRNGFERALRKHKNYDLALDSGLFEAAWYQKRYPDVARSGVDPLNHFLHHGRAQRRDPNPFFSTTYYLEHLTEIGNTDINPLVHFIQQGAVERRNPSEFFDCDWYINMYRDVAGAGMNPLLHYRLYGEAEGRCPNAAFSPSYYRLQHLANEPASSSPLEHYILIGRHQGLDTKLGEVERYRRLTAIQDDKWRAQRSEIKVHIALMAPARHFFIYTDGSIDKDLLCLDAQLYPFWTFCRDKDELLHSAEQLGGAPWSIVWASPDDACHPAMLYCFACEHERDPDVDLVYADDDVLETSGSRSRPFYKPGWSPDYFECCNYIGGAACVSGRLARDTLQESSCQYDFLLRATALARRIIHVPIVLGHRRRSFDGPRSTSEQEADMLAISKALARAGRQGSVRPASADLACYEIVPSASAAMPVSIVIPTAGQNASLNGRKVNLVCNLIARIRDKPAYRGIEVIAVINEDLEDDKRLALHNMDVRTIVYRDPTLNIARKINLGASIAERDFLLLLNDDIEPISDDWIELMLAQFEKSHVGVVGAKLLYGDSKVQHVGVVLNTGSPDHPRSRYSDDDPGYYFSSLATRNFLSVTGAAMLTPRALFENVGGFTTELAISYNDVDYCLKLRDLGKIAVYCANAKLFHYESLSRTRVLDMAEANYFNRRWAQIASDPYYNEEFLTMAPPTYEPCNNGKLIG